MASTRTISTLPIRFSFPRCRQHFRGHRSRDRRVNFRDILSLHIWMAAALKFELNRHNGEARSLTTSGEVFILEGELRIPLARPSPRHVRLPSAGRARPGTSKLAPSRSSSLPPSG